MKATNYYYKEQRLCKVCGEKSWTRVHGSVPDFFPCFNIKKRTYKGKTFSHMQCPKCEHRHDIPFKGVENTYPRLSKSERYERDYKADREQEATHAQ